MSTDQSPEQPRGGTTDAPNARPLSGEAGVAGQDREWDTDSGSGTLTYASSMTSANSTLYQHVEENGRTYHAYKSGKYQSPNDEQEQDRLDLQHASFSLCFEGKLSLAPIEEKASHHVMDIATGTGIWAIDFADQHPSASVVGTDLTPIQPQCRVPPNCRFVVEDAEDDWEHDDKFSYIHARAVLSCFADPSVVIRKAFNALEPGGYIEFQDHMAPFEFVEPPPEDSALAQWNQLSIEASIKGGRPWNNSKNYARWMREAGFVDVEEHKVWVPCGTFVEDPKSRKMGSYHVTNMMQGIDGMTTRNLSRLGWKPEESKVLAARAIAELREGRVKPFNFISAVWGRKPS